MPRASIWIRNENWEKWQASAKGEMVNEMLASDAVDFKRVEFQVPGVFSGALQEGFRTKSSVLDDIHALELEVDRADLTNQDPDYWTEINAKKARIQELWAEWRSL